MRALALVCTVLLACAGEEPSLQGIQTRLFVDRTEARVGDAVGVTIEIETPEGFRLEKPAPPAPNERFLTESLEPLEPLEVPGGTQHRLLWTLRARSVGEHRLPNVDVPLVFPDGRTEPLPVGGVPLPVRSVRDELPERDAYFDIRPPPDPTSGPIWALIAAGVGGLGALLVLTFAVARRRGAVEPPPSEEMLAREAIEAIEAALAESEPRALASSVGLALYAFAGGCFEIETASAVPEDLETRVDARLVELLRELDRARFGPGLPRESVLETARTARAYLRSTVPGAERGPTGGADD
jgi:hypothetical protein